MNSEAILERLRRELPGMSRALQRAAKYVIDHPQSFALDPVRVSAERAGVSPFSFVRLARRLGLAGYAALREPFRAALAGAGGAPAPGAPLPAACASVGANVARSLAALDPAALERAVAVIRSARRAHVLGVRSAYGLAHHFHYVARMAVPGLELVPRQAAQPIDDLAEISPADAVLAITFRPCSKETVQGCLFARSRGARVVTLSDSPVIAPGLEPEAALVARIDSPHAFASFAGAFAVLDVLIAELIRVGGGEARARLAAYARLRDSHFAYWRRESGREPDDAPEGFS